MKDLIKITRLVCFDFDSTLIHTLLPETGIPMWEKKYNLPYQAKGWWGREASLDMDLYVPPVNQWVYDKYLQEIEREDTYVFLATGRLVKLKGHVDAILNHHTIHFDGVFCNTGGDTLKFKCYLFEKKIKEFPNVVEFTMYDDRHEHLKEFVTWAEKQTINKINIIDVVNKKKLL